MKIVVGIGNPDPEHHKTRHNVGFDALDALARRHDAKPASQERFSAKVATIVVDGQKALLLFPQTFVNRSGESVRAALDWYDEPVESLLVVCDDMNLPVGRLRIRRAGGNGGHKGLEAIAYALGTEAYCRLRVGIGKPPPGRAVDYVLSRFYPDERAEVDAAIERAADAVRSWMCENIEACMNEFNAPP